MNSFESSLNKYILHETVITNAIFENGFIDLAFNEGVFYLCKDTDVQKTGACRMRLYIDGFDKKYCHQNVEVKRIENNVIIDMGVDDFLEVVKTEGFKIYLDYYSFVARSILLIGTTENFDMEITVTDIQKIEFESQD